MYIYIDDPTVCIRLCLAPNGVHVFVQIVPESVSHIFKTGVFIFRISCIDVLLQSFCAAADATTTMIAAFSIHCAKAVLVVAA